MKRQRQIGSLPLFVLFLNFILSVVQFLVSLDDHNAERRNKIKSGIPPTHKGWKYEQKQKYIYLMPTTTVFLEKINPELETDTT